MLQFNVDTVKQVSFTTALPGKVITSPVNSFESQKGQKTNPSEQSSEQNHKKDVFSAREGDNIFHVLTISTRFYCIYSLLSYLRHLITFISRFLQQNMSIPISEQKNISEQSTNSVNNFRLFTTKKTPTLPPGFNLCLTQILMLPLTGKKKGFKYAKTTKNFHN